MPPFSSPWFWAVLVVMSVWAMYGLVLHDYSSRPQTEGWFVALVGTPIHGRRTAIIALACNLAAAGVGLATWIVAPAHVYNLALVHAIIILLWVVNVLRTAWAFHLVGKPAPRPSTVHMLAFWGYVLLILAAIMPLTM